MRVHFTVYGHPQPQGSTRAFIPKGWTRPVITTDNTKLKPWRQQLSLAALAALGEAGGEIAGRDTPVFLRLDFYLQRPASLPKRFTWPTKKPDWDKLVRAVCDSMTGVLFDDDSQVVRAVVSKFYGQPERVEIFLATLEREFLTDPAVRESLELFPVEV